MRRRSFVMAMSGAAAWAAGGRRRVVIDADTGNEIDDLFAIVRALKEPGLEVAGLCSAQWHTRISPEDTVGVSQRMNEDLLRLMGRQEVPAPAGAEMIMGMPWGGEEARDSAAARFLMREALAAEEKLTVVATGATTNVASALKLKPEIVSKVRVYLMGAHYDAKTGVWNKDEFNIRNDLNAFNFLLNCEGLDLHVMPANVCGQLVFERAKTMARLGERGAAGAYLAARWKAHAPEAERWVMWDLALVEAVARPELAKEGRFRTPPENRAREVWVYTGIEVGAMEEDFWGRWR